MHTPTPNINTHRPKSILYNYNFPELSLQSPNNNCTPLNSSRINPIPITPRDNWTGLPASGTQNSWIQVHNLGQEKKYDQIVNELKN